jgi:hypothetical protein
MPIVYIRKSNRQNKKWVAILPEKDYPELFNKKTVHFGDSRYDDFTTHKDELRKSRYISRHIKEIEKWRNPNTPAFWSRWLLWNKKSLKDSAKDIEKMFGIKVRFLQE